MGHIFTLLFTSMKHETKAEPQEKSRYYELCRLKTEQRQAIDRELGDLLFREKVSMPWTI